MKVEEILTVPEETISIYDPGPPRMASTVPRPDKCPNPHRTDSWS